MLAHVIRLATRCRYIVLRTPLEPKELVHLIDTQAFSVVDEEPSVDACANQAGREEDIHAPAHAGVHLGQCFGDDQGPNPHACGRKRTRHGAERGGEDLCRDDPGQAVGAKGLSLS